MGSPYRAAVRRLFLLLLASLTCATAQTVTEADSLATLDSTAAVTLDSTAVDSLKAQVDSAAVAALGDTTALTADVLGDGFEVSVFGRPLFEVWGGLGDVSPQERAERLSQRLSDLARSRELDPSGLRAVQGRDLTTLQLGDVIVMTVTDQDAQALGGTRAQAAARYRTLIVEGVTHYREQATLRGVARAAGLTALLFLALLVALRAIAWAFRWVGGRSSGLRERLVRPIQIGTLEVVGQDQVARLGRGVVASVRLAVSAVLVYIFLTTVFGLFAWTQSWSQNLLSAALTPLRQIGAALVSSVDNAVALVVIAFVIRWAIQFSNYLFSQVARGEVEVRGFHPDLADPTRKIAKTVLLIMGLMLAYPYTPIATNRGFQGLTVFFGLLLSFGSSTAISNMVAGVVLTYSRAFRIGDRVRVGDAFGDVVEKTFLVTRIRTPKNEDISVPNSTVLSNHITNYSVMARAGSGVIVHSTITIGYDVPWPQVHRLLLQAARGTAGVEAEPEPFVLQTALGDFSVSYEINAYTREVTRMARLYSELHRNVQDQFAEAGVEILSPTYHARRDAPSTVPSVAALHDTDTRTEVVPSLTATDGADAVPPPETLPDAPPPPLISRLYDDPDEPGLDATDPTHLGTDTDAPEARAPEAGTLDAGALDAGALDAGALDAGALDAGALDAGAQADDSRTT